jgi:[methyl-Co(III) methanol-specific corrinoid protein]:coenzyme M methyltransferase
MARQIFMNALARKNPPGVFALGTGTSIACQDLMRETGAYFPEAHLDVETMARLAIAGHTILGMDVVMPLFSVCHEAAALGCNVDWGAADAMPDCGKPIWSRAEDIRIPPNFLDHPSCQTPLKAISLLKKRLGDSAAVCGKVFGSWTLGYHLFGVENFLIGTLDDPDQTKRIIEKLIPATVAFAKAQIDAGADCILLADHATRDLCSPGAYREFVLPLHARIPTLIPAPVILHICGNTSDRVAMIAWTGLSCFHWDTKTLQIADCKLQIERHGNGKKATSAASSSSNLQSEICNVQSVSAPPAEMRRLAGEHLSLMGGVSNLLLLNGKPDEVTAQARQAAEGGIDIVGPECAIPLRTPLANLKAIAAIRP